MVNKKLSDPVLVLAYIDFKEPAGTQLFVVFYCHSILKLTILIPKTVALIPKHHFEVKVIHIAL